MEIEKPICGETVRIFFDKRFEEIDLELIRISHDKKSKEGFYAIEFCGTDQKKKSKILLRLHIKEAIRLKSVIDNLVYDSLTI